MRRLPAEWEPQERVLLSWPHPASDWASDLDRVEAEYRQLAATITRHQALTIVCANAGHCRHVAGELRRAGATPQRTTLIQVACNDTWIRDYGPITVYEDGRRRLLDFTFDGWGGKFDAALDDAVSRRLSGAGAFGRLPLERIDFILEGGALDSDGCGTLLSTRHYLARRGNQVRDSAGLGRLFSHWFGTERILWLHHGHLEGDDTDGHVDTLARFCSRDTIAYVHCDDTADPQYAELAAMEGELRGLCTRDDQPYRLVPLPWPAARYGDQGERLPATYANFLIINGAVLVPQYGDPADPVARERLGACFPGREIVGLSAAALIRQYGSLHCVTMQIPASLPTDGAPRHSRKL